MPRATHDQPTQTVKVALPADAHACLVKLKDKGRMGSTIAEVAKYLIVREIDDLTRSGVLD